MCMHLTAGRNWEAQVRETIDATLNRVSSSGVQVCDLPPSPSLPMCMHLTLNRVSSSGVQGASYYSGSINSIQRDSDGAYLAVSSRGNFYLT